MNTREKSEIRDLTADEINDVAGGPAGQTCGACSYKSGTYTLGTASDHPDFLWYPQP